MDPPRPEAAEAVAVCRTAGVTPIMITGDHPSTARAIARNVGILDGRTEVLSGPELQGLDEAALADAVGRVHVYARVAPDQKIAIVTALQQRGELVAMTGDGVNDAPAIKRADIGVAMGKIGTDVAREASDMVLLDDNFATIVAAIREGRRIFDNIRRFIRYVLSGNAGEIWTLLLAPLFGLPTPLAPVQILWINLVTDGLPGLALTVEPEERDVMNRPPRAPEETVFAHGVWQQILWVGLLIGALTLTGATVSYHTGSAHWQTMAFTILTMAQLFFAMSVRSSTESLFTQGVRSNVALHLVVLATAGLHLLTIYAGPLNRIFKTTPLTGRELAQSVALASIVFVAVEIEKWIRRRHDGRQLPRTNTTVSS
jgi:Ca2+-transporting ATPase